MNREQAKFELMARAPAVPDWFEPDMIGIQEPTTEQIVLSAHMWGPGMEATKEGISEWREAKRIVKAWDEEREKRRLLQWPSYYAEEILRRGQWPTES